MENPEKATVKAVLVGVDFGKGGFSASLEELELLARSAGAEPVQTVTAKRASPDAAYYVGSGKVDEIIQAVHLYGAEMVIFNHALSPAQQRNLEKRLDTSIVDRTSLILDIFAQRAKSHEGKVQVELAQLQHLMTRLVRGWTHLERQKGGIGLRGPGETQLETDRRLIGGRVKMLRSRLDRLQRQRETQRRSRNRSRTFSMSLVGYTNAGKSTLFNAMTKAGTYAADQLFATLDTTSRRVYIETVGNVVISDTVGFIRDLPHQLVAAFRATLEETIHADMLLHVVDASSDMRQEQIEQVNQVLEEIDAQKVPQLLVLNKIDLAGLEPGIDRNEEGRIRRVSVSAVTGAGLDLLRQAIAEFAADNAKVQKEGVEVKGTVPDPRWDATAS
ncbi:MAG: GTPase HflX [Oxalobacter sp.]|nr:GTPase HflX [Oxalobacter sp.]